MNNSRLSAKNQDEVLKTGLQRAKNGKMPNGTKQNREGNDEKIP